MGGGSNFSQCYVFFLVVEKSRGSWGTSSKCDLWIYSTWLMDIQYVTYGYTLCDLWIYSMWLMAIQYVTYGYKVCDLWLYSTWLMAIQYVSYGYTLCDLWLYIMWLMAIACDLWLYIMWLMAIQYVTYGYTVRDLWLYSSEACLHALSYIFWAIKMLNHFSKEQVEYDPNNYTNLYIILNTTRNLILIYTYPDRKSYISTQWRCFLIANILFKSRDIDI